MKFRWSRMPFQIPACMNPTRLKVWRCVGLLAACATATESSSGPGCKSAPFKEKNPPHRRIAAPPPTAY